MAILLVPEIPAVVLRPTIEVRTIPDVERALNMHQWLLTPTRGLIDVNTRVGDLLLGDLARERLGHGSQGDLRFHLVFSRGALDVHEDRDWLKRLAVWTGVELFIEGVTDELIRVCRLPFTTAWHCCCPKPK